MAQRYGLLPSQVLRQSTLTDYNLDQRVAAAAIEAEVKEKQRALAEKRARRGRT